MGSRMSPALSQHLTTTDVIDFGHTWVTRSGLGNKRDLVYYPGVSIKSNILGIRV